MGRSVVTAVLDRDSTKAIYWSSTRVGVTDASVAEAWSQAAEASWRDELYVTERDDVTWAGFLFNSGDVRMTVCECALLIP